MGFADGYFTVHAVLYVMLQKRYPYLECYTNESHFVIEISEN